MSWMRRYVDYRHLSFVSSLALVNHGRHFVSRVVTMHPTEKVRGMTIIHSLSIYDQYYLSLLQYQQTIYGLILLS